MHTNIITRIIGGLHIGAEGKKELVLSLAVMLERDGISVENVQGYSTAKMAEEVMAKYGFQISKALSERIHSFHPNWQDRVDAGEAKPATIQLCKDVETGEIKAFLVREDKVVEFKHDKPSIKRFAKPMYEIRFKEFMDTLYNKQGWWQSIAAGRRKPTTVVRTVVKAAPATSARKLVDEQHDRDIMLSTLSRCNEALAREGSQHQLWWDKERDVILTRTRNRRVSRDDNRAVAFNCMVAEQTQPMHLHYKGSDEYTCFGVTN